MLSLDLFDSRYEKRLHEGAVDDAEYARLDDLRKKIKVLDLAREKTKDPEMHRAIDDRKKVYADEIKDILSVRGMKEAEQPSQPQTQKTKGIGDIQDPKQKMAQLAQRSKKGPLANVAAGIKAFVKGEPEPMGEQQELGRRGIGMANMKALQSTVEKGFARTVFQFSTGKYVVGEDDTDKMADYYNALDSAGRTNFVYNVLGDGAKFIQMSRELGIQATPVEPQQPELPGMPQASPQRELPLSEKKKSDSDDLEAGDIKVARELQKLRAEYPAARSDVEAVARAEIDSTERSQRQLSAIRGANEKQDALLKQLVALDQEQGREISGLDKENNSLEKQLDQVQRTNAALAQTVSQMTGTKKSARAAPQPTTAQPADNVINLIPGAPADQQKVEPRRKPLAQPVATTDTGKQDTDPAPKLSTDRGPISQFSKYNPPEQLKKPQKSAESKIKEHGGGIGPRQHWQSMMPETALNPQDPQSDYEAKRRALHDLSLNKDVDQAAVLQRRLDLDREAKAKGITETVVDVKSGMAKIYRRLAPKIERHRDSFLAGQLYDELENYAELHGAEGEFKRMMATARNSAHMEYDTNPGGFQNWFWFLPFADEQVEEGWFSSSPEEKAKKKLQVEQQLKQTLNNVLNEALPELIEQINYNQFKSVGPRWGGIRFLVFGALPILDDSIKQELKKVSDAITDKLKFFGSVPDLGTLDNERNYLLKFNQQMMIDKEYVLKLLNQYIKLLNTGLTKLQTIGKIEPTLNQDVAEGTDDIKKRMSKLEALALAANRAGDDAKCKMYQEKIQALKQKLSQSMEEGWSDQGNPTAFSVYIDGREWRAYKSDEQARRVAEKVQANLKLQGRDQTVTIAPSRTKKVNEAKEIVTKNDFLDRRDYLLRKIDADSNPANKQIIRAEIRKLESQAEAEGWITMQQRMVREDSDSGEAVEMAIMRRMLVAHTDLIVEFGLDKVVDAIEEVAYNVGDTDEIGTSDVSGWVHQVRQILGADA